MLSHDCVVVFGSCSEEEREEIRRFIAGGVQGYKVRRKEGESVYLQYVGSESGFEYPEGYKRLLVFLRQKGYMPKSNVVGITCFERS